MTFLVEDVPPCSSAHNTPGEGGCLGEAELCWVCLDNGTEQPLVQPCKCPRVAHPKCLARWQLQSAGRDEEQKCRFCLTSLPDWRPILTPREHFDQPAIPVVSVHYNGVCYKVKVKPGAEGVDEFRKQLHKITGQPLSDCMQITFQCKSPDTAQEISLKGMSAFGAAIHCAAVSSSQRAAMRRSAEIRRSLAGNPAATGDRARRAASSDGPPLATGLPGRRMSTTAEAESSSSSASWENGAVVEGTTADQPPKRASTMQRFREALKKLFA